MSSILCVPFGGASLTVEDRPDFAEALEETFAREITISGPRPLPEGLYDPQRQQHNSEQLLRIVNGIPAEPGDRVLGITGADLFIPMLTFVFGQAQLGGRAAVVSTARLSTDFYRLPPDPVLRLRRTIKEAVHELGHTFWLTHCLDPRCPMSLSTTVTAIDAKSASLCRNCRIALRAHQPS